MSIRLLAVALILLAEPAQAELSLQFCLNRTLNAAVGSTGPQALDISQYAQDKAVLVLADGDPFDFDSRHLSIAGEVHWAFPDKKIVSGNINFPKTSFTEGGLTRIKMDNSKPFPFTDNSFDKIILRRGLCVCNPRYACAGFCAKDSEAKDFFEQVIRVLNKNNPNARAYLHGHNKVWKDSEISLHWQKVLAELSDQYAVDVDIHFGSDDYLHSISIKPRDKP